MRQGKPGRDICSSHQKLESEEENNYFVTVKVVLVVILRNFLLNVKEEPIKEENVKDTKSPQITFPCDLCDKTVDSRVYHLDYGRQFPYFVCICYAGKQIKHCDEKNFVCMECGKY